MCFDTICVIFRHVGKVLVMPWNNIICKIVLSPHPPTFILCILILSKFICLPTDAQLNCLKNYFKI